MVLVFQIENEKMKIQKIQILSFESQTSFYDSNVQKLALLYSPALSYQVKHVMSSEGDHGQWNIDQRRQIL